MLDLRRVEDYRTMMEDQVRMRAYLRALRRHAPGRTVVDLGAGLGPLSLMALHGGAKRVYAIEADAQTLDLACRIARNNGFREDRFVPVCGRSDGIDLPERGDLLVSETLDGAGIGENTDYFVQDARRRLLTPDARLIPDRLELFVALGDSAEDAAERRFWSQELARRYGIDFRTAVEELSRHRHTRRVESQELLSEWVRWADLHLSTEDRPCGDIPRTRLNVTRPGTVRGIAFAFRAHLDPEIHIDTRSCEEPTHWQQGWIPAPEPFEVAKGEAFDLDICVGRSNETWRPLTTSLLPASVSLV